MVKRMSGHSDETCTSQAIPLLATLKQVEQASQHKASPSCIGGESGGRPVHRLKENMLVSAERGDQWAQILRQLASINMRANVVVIHRCS
jgi:hypothetical protein